MHSISNAKIILLFQLSTFFVHLFSIHNISVLTNTCCVDKC